MKNHCSDNQDSPAYLSLTEYGAYAKLMASYIDTARPLPSDLDSLYRICGAIKPIERWAVKGVARRFFSVSDLDGLRHNQEADEAIAKKQPKINAARLNGKKGGRPRKTITGTEL